MANLFFILDDTKINKFLKLSLCKNFKKTIKL